MKNSLVWKEREKYVWCIILPDNWFRSLLCGCCTNDTLSWWPRSSYLPASNNYWPLAIIVQHDTVTHHMALHPPNDPSHWLHAKTSIDVQWMVDMMSWEVSYEWKEFLVRIMGSWFGTRMWLACFLNVMCSVPQNVSKTQWCCLCRYAHAIAKTSKSNRWLYFIPAHIQLVQMLLLLSGISASILVPAPKNNCSILHYIQNDPYLASNILENFLYIAHPTDIWDHQKFSSCQGLSRPLDFSHLEMALHMNK